MKISLTGADTITLGSTGVTGRVLADFANGDIGMLDFPNELVTVTRGKNGNTIYALNATGLQGTLTLRLLRGSDDDKYINSEMNAYLLDPPSYVLLEGEVVKRVGDGSGTVNADTYRFQGALVSQMPAVKDNVEGDVEQAVTEWTLMFGNAARSIT